MITDEELDALIDTLTALKSRVERLEKGEAAVAYLSVFPSQALLPISGPQKPPATAWSSLVRWVRSLATAYQLDNHDLPHCWHDHGAYVRELAALHAAHNVALLSPGRDGRAMVTWHSDLHTALTRLRSSHVGQRCATQHTDASVVRPERTGRIVNEHMQRSHAPASTSSRSTDKHDGIIEVTGSPLNSSF